MSRPSISVVMPAFDAERWIGEALECVLAQTVRPDEVIVVDDGSRDATAARARSVHRMVRIFRQENRGVADATNRGIAEATGDYVAICPADDRWEPHKLEWQLDAIDCDPAIDVSFGRARYFGAEDRDFPEPPGTGILDLDRFAPALYIKNLIANPSAVVRRALYQRLGRYREWGGAEDYDFWLRAVMAGATFHYDPRLLVRLRQHGGNLSSQALKNWEAQYELHREHAALVPDTELVRRVLARDLAVIARCRVGLGMAAEASRAYSESFKLRRTLRAGLLARLLALPGANGMAGLISEAAGGGSREQRAERAA